jgi:hypothetical protein
MLATIAITAATGKQCLGLHFQCRPDGASSRLPSATSSGDSPPLAPTFLVDATVPCSCIFRHKRFWYRVALHKWSNQKLSDAQCNLEECSLSTERIFFPTYCLRFGPHCVGMLEIRKGEGRRALDRSQTLSIVAWPAATGCGPSGFQSFLALGLPENRRPYR